MQVCCWIAIAKDVVDLQSTAIYDNEESSSNESSTFITIEEDESKVNVSLGETESHNEMKPLITPPKPVKHV